MGIGSPFHWRAPSKLKLGNKTPPYTYIKSPGTETCESMRLQRHIWYRGARPPFGPGAWPSGGRRLVFNFVWSKSADVAFVAGRARVGSLRTPHRAVTGNPSIQVGTAPGARRSSHVPDTVIPSRAHRRAGPARLVSLLTRNNISRPRF